MVLKRWQAVVKVAAERGNPPDVNLARKHAGEKQPVFIPYDPHRPARLLLPAAPIDG
jgi:hypothetical protein